jgi:hypothetical protein
MLKILQEIFVELKESFINFNMILGKPLIALLLLLQSYMIFVLQGIEQPIYKLGPFGETHVHHLVFKVFNG